MDKIAMAPAADRRDLFSESATRLGMSPVIVEKDFWVCWILKRLFADPQLKDQMVFKGGTTLSKAYSLIDRFSEDNISDPAFGHVKLEIGERLAKGPVNLGVSGLLFPLLTGILVDRVSYTPVFVLASVMPLVGTTALLTIGKRNRFNRPTA